MNIAIGNNALQRRSSHLSFFLRFPMLTFLSVLFLCIITPITAIEAENYTYTE